MLLKKVVSRDSIPKKSVDISFRRDYLFFPLHFSLVSLLTDLED